MDDKYTKALADAQEFVLAHQGLADTREVRCIAMSAPEDYQLDLGTVRALVELAQLRVAEDATSAAPAHVHNEWRCPPHIEGCGCPDPENSLCNPYYSAGYCPDVATTAAFAEPAGAMPLEKLVEQWRANVKQIIDKAGNFSAEHDYAAGRTDCADELSDWLKHNQPDVTFPGRCSRCGAEPAPNQASTICEDCYPGTPLCRACYVAHAREILTDPAYQHPGAASTSSARAEKLKLAARIVAEAGEAPAPAGTPLAGVVMAMRNAPTGQRGRTLYNCAYILGADGTVTKDAAWDALREAAVDHRMSDDDFSGTFQSGWGAGLKAAG